jgi:hypothetical protein
MKMQMNEIGRHGYRRLYRSALAEAAALVRKSSQVFNPPPFGLFPQYFPRMTLQQLCRQYLTYT